MIRRAELVPGMKPRAIRWSPSVPQHSYAEMHGASAHVRPAAVVVPGLPAACHLALQALTTCCPWHDLRICPVAPCGCHQTTTPELYTSLLVPPSIVRTGAGTWSPRELSCCVSPADLSTWRKCSPIGLKSQI